MVEHLTIYPAVVSSATAGLMLSLLSLRSFMRVMKSAVSEYPVWPVHLGLGRSGSRRCLVVGYLDLRCQAYVLLLRDAVAFEMGGKLFLGD
ncbi:hypothetical protein PG984_016212 [Apiospora sp. TS-2023a]